MPEYIAPGAYIEETAFRSKSIEGVDTNATVFLGVVPPILRKPDAGKTRVSPQIATFAEIELICGSLRDVREISADDVQAFHWLLAAVKGFFANGGRNCSIGYFDSTAELIACTDFTPLLGSATEDGPVSLAAAPGLTDAAAQMALEAACESMKLFTILDVPQATSIDSRDSYSALLAQHAGRFNTQYAALYAPWLTLADGALQPPSGHVAGVFARSDLKNGVHKAPASLNVEGIQGVNGLFNPAQQAALNAAGVNLIRDLRSERKGILLWGARTLSKDAEWKYVNVRRCATFLERSIEQGTQWTVFEPNNEALWVSVRRMCEDFLLNQWQIGTLMGNRPQDAFFVRCDRTTMTQDDLDNGRLITLVGVAVVRPAEFVIFRIGQLTADSGDGDPGAE